MFDVSSEQLEPNAIGTVVASVMGYRVEALAEAILAIAYGVLTAVFVSRQGVTQHAAAGLQH